MMGEMTSTAGRSRWQTNGDEVLAMCELLKEFPQSSAGRAIEFIQDLAAHRDLVATKLAEAETETALAAERKRTILDALREAEAEAETTPSADAIREAVLAERERCAKIADHYAFKVRNSGYCSRIVKDIAFAIRAEGEG